MGEEEEIGEEEHEDRLPSPRRRIELLQAAREHEMTPDCRHLERLEEEKRERGKFSSIVELSNELLVLTAILFCYMFSSTIF